MAYQYRSPLEGIHDDGYRTGKEPEFLPYASGAPSGSIGHRSMPQTSTSFLDSPALTSSNPRFNHPPRTSRETPYDRRQNEPSHQFHPKYSDRFRQTSYPRELTDMFGALECKLCSVEVDSPIVAKMHYSGQKHLKKVRSYLLQWSSKTGLPMPTVEGPNLSSSSVNDMENYCEVCDVTMVSVSDKVLHYSGKNHQKNVKKPENAKKKKKTYEMIDLSSRFGIGSDFKKEICDTTDDNVKSNENVKEFVCDICNVRAVSKEQLKDHLTGRKHKERVAKKDKMVHNPVNPSVSILASVVKDQPRDIIDYSMHRTPSGHYYCGVCNLTLNSELQFIEHIENKKHKKNFTGKKTHK